MEKILIANTTLLSSRIALGTASLHHLRSARERERLILTALDHGITHFDTSPYYGFGIGETSLAPLASRGPAITIATKVGLYPPGGADAPAAAVLARKVLGKMMPALSAPIADMSVALARRSLRDSLRRLKRERVDLLLIHEPNLQLLSTEEWLRWLDSERDKIGAVGVAGEASRVLPFVESNSPFASVIQTRDSAAGAEAAALRGAGRVPQITYGHLARLDGSEPVADIVGRSLRQFPQTVLLFSTRRADRIGEMARCAQSLH
jgi:D-threo-aldose 1-dehydrogenase